MNTAWNVVMKLSSINNKDVWGYFWFMEAIVALVSIGATTVIGWLVGLIIGEPNMAELVLGFIVIYLTNEHYVLLALDYALDAFESSGWFNKAK